MPRRFTASSVTLSGPPDPPPVSWDPWRGNENGLNGGLAPATDPHAELHAD
jgi:hypothetical protein